MALFAKSVIKNKQTRQPIIPQRNTGLNATNDPIDRRAPKIRNPLQRQPGNR